MSGSERSTGRGALVGRAVWAAAIALAVAAPRAQQAPEPAAPDAPPRQQPAVPDGVGPDGVGPDGVGPDGAALFAEGRYEDAAAAFRLRAAAAVESPEVQYNLALALWRSGDLVGAEEAVEKYAAMPGGGRVDLHRGLLGVLRMAAAERLIRAHIGAADAMGGGAQLRAQLAELLPGYLLEGPMPTPDDVGANEPGERKVLDFTAARDAAARARDHFVAAASAPGAGPQHARNLERALRLIAGLDQLEQTDGGDEPSPDGQDPDQQPQDPKDPQDGEPKPSDQQQQPEQQPGEQQPEQQPEQPSSQDPQQGEARPEPRPDPQQPDRQTPDQQQPEPQSGQQDPGPPQPGESQQPGDERPQPQPGEESDEPPSTAAAASRADAPGEHGEGMQLTEEQRQRLLMELEKLDRQLQQIRAQARSQRARVGRDW